MTDAVTIPSSAENANPLLQPWDTPFGVPPFNALKAEHFRGAFDAAFAEHARDMEAVVGNEEVPNFKNVIAAMELAGQTLWRVTSVFFNLCSADTNEALQEIERDVAPRFSKHFDAIFQNEDLFQRVDALWKKRESLGLTPEEGRVLERYHLGFVRAGAGLDEKKKQRLAAINERLATLYTVFGQNILADEADFKLVLEDETDLEGLPEFVRAAAAEAAAERDLPGKHLVTLARSSVETFLQFSSRRDLREKAFEAWTQRGERGGKTDNRENISEIIKLRDERAHILGFESFAHFELDDTMAKTPEAVDELLDQVWEPACKRAAEEREELQAMVRAEGGNFDLAGHDWRYYAEKLRKEKHDLNEEEIKPYLQLDKIIEAAFDTAERLFGLTFERRDDIPLYHKDVRAWEVRYGDGREPALFLGDYFARPSKRSGAWMSSYRPQQKLAGNIRPIIVNVLNFSKGAGDTPALLSFDDAVTLFHEFGHALHGLLSDVTYPMVAGTRVSTDFVELPSQLYEHWIWQPEVLKRYAVHYQSGEPIPDALVERIVSARNFNQGFATIEYLACAKLDMELHRLKSFDGFDPARFEADALKDIGMPEEIVMRHRVPHFLHIFTGDSYAAGYYSYLWSEVMDADAFAAFEEAGDIFAPDVAKGLHDHIYSAGGRMDPAKAYEAFRGRLPEADALLKKRGFSTL